MLGTRRGQHFFESTPMYGQVLLPRKTSQRMKHILHMFCERTVTNIRHVACQWRGTAVSRRRPLPIRTAHCRWRLSRRFLPVVTEHTQFCVAGTGSLPFSGTKMGPRASIRQHLERPNIVLSGVPDMLILHKQARAKKKNLRAGVLECFIVFFIRDSQWKSSVQVFSCKQNKKKHQRHCQYEGTSR